MNKIEFETIKKHKKDRIFKKKMDFKYNYYYICGRKRKTLRMITVFIITFILIVVCVLLLGIKVFFTKNGTFPSTHIGGNGKIKEKGISCAQAQDFQERSQEDLFDRIKKR